MLERQLFVYNTLTRQKELFTPLNPSLVGLYVCGPTVYGYPHLGHSRGPIIFDVVHRYFIHLGYKVKYIRNITDVGHLVNDADDTEDKIIKKARLEKLEPMEIAQFYANAYHNELRKLNILDPTIEPLASGHIIEQQELIEKIIKQGYGYVVNGSVYFDVRKYHQNGHNYGKLSGRVIDELLAGAGEQARELEGQEEKKYPSDFALWKKAAPEHIMRWPSPWGDGFPGWHIECSAMSNKYLGNTFDIHGGGMDLLFPHHECEIAQAVASTKEALGPARYWMHHNMITINGQKMAKSLNNGINLKDLFIGNHPLLDKAYSPMTLRFFVLQAHYRSTLDFSNEALTAAGKGYKKLMNGMRLLKQMNYNSTSEVSIDKKLEEEISSSCNACYEALNDDFNTALALASIFNLIKKINSFHTKQIAINSISESVFEKMKTTCISFVETILGLIDETSAEMENMIQLVLEAYKKAKQRKDYVEVDFLRAELKKHGIVFKDGKEAVDWAYEE